MEQFSDNKLISGISKISTMNTTRRAGLGLWDFQSYHASSDASLFSSSLPVLPHEKLIINDRVDDRQSIDAAAASSHNFHEDVEGEDSLEDIAKQTIGFLLPDNEDELFADIIDYDTSAMPSQLEEPEEADIFDSVGGMDLGNDMPVSLNLSMAKMNLSDVVLPNGMVHYAPSSSAATVAGEHPFGEHPSRTLFVRNINSNVEDTELRSLFEQYGDIRTLYTACKHRGFVMISYYDIRDARAAMRALQNKPLRRRKLDIHFSIPKDNPSEKDVNQGTLVVFNLDPSVSNEDLLQIFGTYGEVKEIRETPHKRHHKFIEFYDVRAAEAALRALNRSDIAGKRIKLEPSRPGGTRRSLLLQMNQELEGDDSRAFRHHVGSPVASSPPGNWMQFNSPVEQGSMHTFSRSPGYKTLSPSTSNLPGLASILHSQATNSLKIAPIGQDVRGGHIDHIFSSSAEQRSNFPLPHSLPDLKLGHLSNNISSFGASTSNGSGIETLSGPQFLWGSSTNNTEKPKVNAWPSSSGGHPLTFSSPGQGFPYPPNRHSSFMGSSQIPHPHHVGSAPSGIHFQRQFGFFPESPETSIMKPGAFGGMNLGGRSNGSYMMNMSAPRPAMHDVLGGNITENGSSPSYRMMSSPRLSPIFLGNGPYSGLTLNGGEAERGRARRIETNANQLESKKQFQLDLEKIACGEDTRTTLMIKNIPNKYTSKMLLAAIDENHKGTYDFLYLPIDFKNKCNVGYAFINMLSPTHIIPFYQAFNGKKWEKFNSEKVASLAYARIQGRAALIAHFQNSSLMNEDKRCRPILFHSESTESGEQIIQEHLPSTGLNLQVLDSKDAADSEETHIGTISKSGLDETHEKT